MRPPRRYLLFVIAAVLCWAVPALAKPKIAILGLEVIDDGTMDQRTTLRGKHFTKSLRSQTNRPGGKFQLAANSKKDLLEMKLLSNCSDEARQCMAAIGRELNSDRLMFGKIERRPEGYLISLKLLDTKTGDMIQRRSITVPFSESVAGQIEKHSTRLYRLLTGEVGLGSLQVSVTNTDKGTIYLDGEIRTSLAAGTATLKEVSEGSHTIAIEAAGFKRRSEQVSIAPGQVKKIEFTLTRLGSDRVAGGGRPGGIYRGATYFLGAAFTATTIGWIVEGVRVRGFEDDKTKEFDGLSAAELSELEMQGSEQQITNDVCNVADKTSGGGGLERLRSACSSGQKAEKYTNYLIAASVVTGLAAVLTGYKGWVSSSSERRGSAKKKKTGGDVRVESLISPTTIGAGVRIEF